MDEAELAKVRPVEKVLEPAGPLDQRLGAAAWDGVSGVDGEVDGAMCNCWPNERTVGGMGGMME